MNINNSLTRSKSSSIRSTSRQSLSITDQFDQTSFVNDQFDSSMNTNDNQNTLDLLEKIRQTEHAELIGPMPLSLQVN